MDIRRFNRAVIPGLTLLLAAALTPALADPLPDTESLPRVAFLARSDVAVDALAAGPVAGAMGAIMIVTPPTSLHDNAAAAITEFAPDVLIVAGGTDAISDEVATAAQALCDPCTVDRRAGAQRWETAQLLGKVPADYGYTRPLVAGTKQVEGDVLLGGRITADSARIEKNLQARTIKVDQKLIAPELQVARAVNDNKVQNLNADYLDGLSKDDFLKRDGTADNSARLQNFPHSDFRNLVFPAHSAHYSGDFDAQHSYVRLHEDIDARLSFSFVLPDDYTAGDPMIVRVMFREASDAESCTLRLLALNTQGSLADGSTSSDYDWELTNGSAPVQLTIEDPAAAPNEDMFQARFRLEGTDRNPGDVQWFEMMRNANHATDTCGPMDIAAFKVNY